MRLWTLHPSYLDAAGLVAAWREGLLAQKVLLGKTSGYRNHPQLNRFKASADPIGLIGLYLERLASEADRRGYRFDRTKIRRTGDRALAAPTASGQVEYEFALLRRKLAARNPQKLAEIGEPLEIEVNAAFRIVPGGIEAWEKVLDEIDAARRRGDR